MKSLNQTSAGSGLDNHAFNDQALLARCMGSVPFANALLSEFEMTGESRLAELTRHAAEGNLGELTEAAHALKGVAGILAAERLQSLAAEVESAGRSHDFPIVSSLVEDLCQEMLRCLAEVSRVSERINAA